MNRVLRRAWVAPAFLLVGALGCSKAPKPEPVKSEAEAAAKAEAKNPPPLSEEDKRLIAADPSTLTPEERRKRGYALRRKIMQNPDSASARALEDLAKATKEGTIDPKAGKSEGLILHQRGVEEKPKSGPPPAGYRPPKDERPASE